MISLAWTVVISLTLVLPATADAVDIPIPGQKLRIKTEPASRRKRHFFFSTGRDDAVVIGSDPTIGGATLLVAGLDCIGSCTTSGSSGLIHLPAANWTALGNPPGARGYRYKMPDGSAGGIRKIRLKSGKLLIKGAGENWPWLPAGGEDGVALTLEIGGQRYCAQFGGVEKANAEGYLSYRNANAPAACPELCGNDTKETSEDCDGSDSAACPGLCQSDCTCPPPVCGNGVFEEGEDCDAGQIAQFCGADISQIGCTTDCNCCVDTGWFGCDFFDCCDPGAYCYHTANNNGVCYLPGQLGDPCGGGVLEAPCANHLICCPEEIFPDGFTGTCCCSVGACVTDEDCCDPERTCQNGQCTL